MQGSHVKFPQRAGPMLWGPVSSRWHAHTARSQACPERELAFLAPGPRPLSAPGHLWHLVLWTSRAPWPARRGRFSVSSQAAGLLVTFAVWTGLGISFSCLSLVPTGRTDPAWLLSRPGTGAPQCGDVFGGSGFPGGVQVTPGSWPLRIPQNRRRPWRSGSGGGGAAAPPPPRAPTLTCAVSGGVRNALLVQTVNIVTPESDFSLFLCLCVLAGHRALLPRPSVSPGACPATPPPGQRGAAGEGSGC